ncbi:hypothetical protein BDK92_1959 [Micromonospora pisi]|uniref:Uncharacterized protein n=1 Tax=Micromonospora pisi TaxID=589240 RepID=A0A495JFI7_9ACTN|nr:hypothetical protein [Micromonospora pisi]RKR87667.1 hypothetical protein BDK92_1959 [Micromonospora pisi]
MRIVLGLLSVVLLGYAAALLWAAQRGRGIPRAAYLALIPLNLAVLILVILVVW